MEKAGRSRFFGGRRPWLCGSAIVLAVLTDACLLVALGAGVFRLGFRAYHGQGAMGASHSLGATQERGFLACDCAEEWHTERAEVSGFVFLFAVVADVCRPTAVFPPCRVLGIIERRVGDAFRYVFPKRCAVLVCVIMTLGVWCGVWRYHVGVRDHAGQSPLV